MSGIIFAGSVIAMLLGVGVWAWRRAADLHEEAQRREAAALQMLLVKPATADNSEANNSTLLPPDSASLVVGGQSNLSTPVVSKAAQNAQDAPYNVTIREVATIERRAEDKQNAPVTLTTVTKLPTPATPLAGLSLRDLILSFYEVRGYREEWAAPDIRPVELVLRNRHDQSRSYAFVYWQQTASLDASAVSRLARELTARGFKRAIVAAERGFDAAAAEAAKKLNMRLYDEGLIKSHILELAPEIQAKLAGMSQARAQKRKS